jgi:hypothetical protein
MWKAETRPSLFQASQEKKVFQDPISTEKKLNMVVLACHSTPVGKKPKTGGLMSSCA